MAANQKETLQTQLPISEETRSNIQKIAEIEASQRTNRTTAEKIAEVIAGFCSSMTFVYVPSGLVWRMDSFEFPFQIDAV